MSVVPDNFAYVIPVEDEILHTPEHPYCWDSACPCKADTEAYTQVKQFVADGLLTPDEAVLFIAGKTV